MGSLQKRLRPLLLFVYAIAGAILYYSRPSAQSLTLGLVPVVLGESLRLWATTHLHKNDALTVSGPYAYLRNPLYLGTLLIGCGFAIVASTSLAYALLGIFLLGYYVYYMPYKNRIEGARLEALYGDAFRRYAIAVPSLLPRLHPYVPLGAEEGSAPNARERFLDNNEVGTAAVVGVGVLALVFRWLII